MFPYSNMHIIHFLYGKIFAISHFCLWYNYLENLLIDLSCQGDGSGRSNAASTIHGDRGRSQAKPSREVIIKYSNLIRPE